MNRFFYYLTIGFATLALTLSAFETQAKGRPQRPGDVGPGDSWQQPPFDFHFGNHVDTHVQLKLKEDQDGKPIQLWGSFYIIFTENDGMTPIGTDSVSGLPIARHPRGANHNEVCGIDPITCYVGWYIDAVPGAAKFLYHSGVNGDDHPVWMVNRAEEYDPLTLLPTSTPGMLIPQPGAYSHFHWIASDSDDPRAIDVSAACDKDDAGQLEDADGLNDPTAVNEVCQGWFLEIKAVYDGGFALEHGGEHIPVYVGTDLRSHLNMVTNYDETPVLAITPTR